MNKLLEKLYYRKNEDKEDKERDEDMAADVDEVEEDCDDCEDENCFCGHEYEHNFGNEHDFEQEYEQDFNYGGCVFDYD